MPGSNRFETPIRILGTEDLTSLLLFEGTRWRHRSVTKLTIRDQATVRWQVSTDFTVPERFDPDPDEAAISSPRKGAVYVPVALVSKRKLSGVDLFDESGTRVSALNRDHEQQLTLNMLIGLWRSYVPSETDDIDEIHVRRIINDDGKHVEYVWRASALIADLLMLEPREAKACLAMLREDGIFDRIPNEKHRSNFLDVLSLLVRAAVLYGVFSGLTPGDRKVIKVAFEDELPSPNLRRTPTTDRSRRDIVEIGLQSLGIKSTPLYWRVSGAAGVQSYHVEADAPDGLVFIDGFVADESAIADSDRPWWRALRKPEYFTARLDTVRPDSVRAHLHPGRAVKDGALLYGLFLRAKRRGWMRAAVTTCAFIAIALLAIAIDITRLYRVDRATTVAGAILAVGTIAAVFLSRPTEHHLTSRILLGARILLFVSAACGLIAVWALLRIQAPAERPIARAVTTEVQIDGERVYVALPQRNEPENPPPPAAMGFYWWARWWLAGVACVVAVLISATYVSWHVSSRRLRKVAIGAEKDWPTARSVAVSRAQTL
jgi:hypothetical protein